MPILQRRGAADMNLGVRTTDDGGKGQKPVGKWYVLF